MAIDNPALDGGEYFPDAEVINGIKPINFYSYMDRLDKAAASGNLAAHMARHWGKPPLEAVDRYPKAKPVQLELLPAPVHPELTAAPANVETSADEAPNLALEPRTADEIELESLRKIARRMLYTVVALGAAAPVIEFWPQINHFFGNFFNFGPFN